jgi:hypothetical protein
MDIKKMSPCELADWMKCEHHALHELNRVIKEHIAQMPEVGLGDWLKGLKVAFERLRVHLERNFAAKEEGGYLSVVTEKRPSLASQVEALRSEHEQLLSMCSGILQALEHIPPAHKLLVEDLCARIERLMAAGDEHERREVMLTMTVCSLDLGGKG